MAGMTNFTILVGGDADQVDRREITLALARHDVTAGVEPRFDGTWVKWHVFDLDQFGFDERIRPLLDEVERLGAYWRVAQEARDDFEAMWFDSVGRHGFDDPFADIADGGHRSPTHTVHLTDDELRHVIAALDYRAYNFLDLEPSFADEVEVNSRMLERLSALAGRR